MHRATKLVVPAALIAAAFFLNTGASFAKPDYSRRTKKDCAFCHPKDSWNLNDAGKYYRDHKYSLDGYKPPAK
jgi:hypothetical protein